MQPIYLTFDDGPDPQWTPRILDTLAAAQVPATFFVIGNAALRDPALVRRAAAEGHEIANHTLEHRHPWAMTSAQARRQVREGAQVLQDVLGRATRFYRPPHGRNRACMSDEAREQGETTVMWSLSAIDWGVMGRADRIASRLQRIQAGDIVLLHDGRNKHNRPDQLMAVLPAFLDQLKRSGLQPAALD
ncbi:MAG TPA: polysaccharide deacetylase family protein [Steroidobacteraceae bacterium]|jgi:peptidoglycan/xylan/chitin deacetylase (PgdA/CDA1 family)